MKQSVIDIRKELFKFAILFFFPIILFSQSTDSKYYTSKKSTTRITNKISNRNTINDAYRFCDTDQDGITTINIDEITSSELKKNIGSFNSNEGIYICTSNSKISLVTNLSTDPIINDYCSTPSLFGGLFDIAINPEHEIFVTNSNKILSLNPDCSIKNTITTSGRANSLSFDQKGNLYFGGYDSNIYRLDKDNFNQTNIWHQFGSGRASGDFIIFNNKMYIAWNLSGRDKLYEVTVDDNLNFISHKDLGELPYGTFGLAGELGSLYGVTSNELYKIDLKNMTFESVLRNTTPFDSWYGAAGLNESVSLDLKAYETLQNAEENKNELPLIWTNTIPNEQTIYVKITNTTNNQYVIATVKIIINIPPVYTNPVSISNCPIESKPAIFDLRKTEPNIIGSQMNLKVSYHDTENNAINDTNPLADFYQANNYNEEIYVRITNTLTTCFSVFSFQLNTLTPPTYTSPIVLSNCSIDSNPAVFNLRKTETNIIGNQTNLTVSYHSTEQDAIDNKTPLADFYQANNHIQEIYVRVTNSLTTCFSVFDFELNSTKAKPSFNKPEDLIICQTKSVIDEEINLDELSTSILEGHDIENLTVSYYNSNQDAILDINPLKSPFNLDKVENEIFIRVGNNSGCFETDSFKIHIGTYNNISSFDANIKTKDWTNNENSIEIFVNGTSKYEYAIDGINYQKKPVFENIPPGEYLISIRDSKNCTISSKEIFILMYPTFFTPNGDGFNDFWNIDFSNTEPEMKISIFDRYGKLLKSLSPLETGWDGNFNNLPLSASDYWFIVDRKNGKQYKGHFSLKR